jgi:hypothetical protein
MSSEQSGSATDVQTGAASTRCQLPTVDTPRLPHESC